MSNMTNIIAHINKINYLKFNTKNTLLIFSDKISLYNGVVATMANAARLLYIFFIHSQIFR